MHSKCNFLHFAGLGREVIEDGRPAVSETATNALLHARSAPGTAAPVPPEL